VARFTIIHHDSRLLVLDKPSGLLAVPGRGPELQDCLASRVQQVFPTARVVHRLDRDTSGLMLMALDLEAQRRLSRQFERRLVQKRYECIVSGLPAVTWPSPHGTASTGTPAGPPRPAGGCSSSRTTAPGWQSNRSPGGPTRSGCIWQRSVTPFWATRSMPIQLSSPPPTGCCCMPVNCQWPTRMTVGRSAGSQPARFRLYHT
jgi:hypothetical protein